MTRRRLRALLAEGDSGEAAAALHELYSGIEPGLDLTVVSTVATLLPTIKIVDPEVILLDLKLDLRDPMDAVHLVRRTAPGVPLIVIADAAQKEQAIRSLAEGAIDYVLKGHIDAHTLERVVRASLEHNTLTGLTDMLRDPVTGLYSRDGFLTVGTRRLEEATRSKGSLVLICQAFENLAALRQEFGSRTADRALSDFAGLMAGCCRRSDVLGRVGDAQFAVLGVDAAPPSAGVIRNRLEKRVSVYNQTRSPWGPIELRTAVGAWSAPDSRSFAEFLESVESRLRMAPAGVQT